MIRPPSSYPLIVSVGNKMTDWLAHEMHYFLHLEGSRVHTLVRCNQPLDPPVNALCPEGASIIFGDVPNVVFHADFCCPFLFFLKRNVF